MVPMQIPSVRIADLLSFQKMETQKLQESPMNVYLAHERISNCWWGKKNLKNLEFPLDKGPSLWYTTGVMRIDLRRSIRNIVLLVKGLVMPTEVAEPPTAEDVVTSTEDVEEKGKKRGRVAAENDPREEFIPSNEMLDEDGKINVWPSDCEYIFGSEETCHRPIKKALFAADEIYVDYRVAVKQSVIEVLQKEIVEMKKARDQFSSIDNVDTREKMKKAYKLRSQIRALSKVLVEAGCNVDDFMDD